MTLIKFSPDRKKNGLALGFNDVFDSILNDSFFSDRLTARVPAANISETQDHFHIELAAPGLNKEDFKLNLERNDLTISVEKQNIVNQEQKNYAKREYSHSSFVRSFSLPDSAEFNDIEASYQNGVLVINIPKREETKTVRREIEIK